MENHIKTTGIVLRRIDFGEADQMVHILTQDQGKVTVLAKGARRLKSRFLGKLELLSYVKLTYFQGRGLGHLNEVESKTPIQETDLNLRSRSLLFYVAEVTHKLIPDGQECGPTFELLHDFLARFEISSAEPLFYGYLVKLLAELGFMADWSHCNESNQKLDLSQPYFLSVHDGSLTQQVYLAQGAPPLHSSLIKWVNFMQKADFEQLKKIRASQKECDDMNQLIKTILQTLTPHPFKSELFMKLV